MAQPPEASLGFRIPAQTKEDFQKWCENHGTTVTRQLVAMVEACLLSPDHNRVDWLGNVFRHYHAKMEIYHRDLRVLEMYVHNYKHLEDVVNQSDHYPLTERIEDLEQQIGYLSEELSQLRKPNLEGSENL